VWRRARVWISRTRWSSRLKRRSPRAAGDPGSRSTHATIWVANRGVHTIRGFDARTGEVVHTVAMAPNSQPGDLAFAKGKLYVAEEFGTPPSIAIVDPEPGGSL
jgi:hypothetical protein